MKFRLIGSAIILAIGLTAKYFMMDHDTKPVQAPSTTTNDFSSLKIN